VDKLTLNSYAKLNLYLEVRNIRKDNYHNIKTLFERIDLSDKIILNTRPKQEIRVICRSSDVPKDKSNLCYQAARLLQDNLKVKHGVDIEIIKNIPVGAGLGGGSSNAATALLGLNKLWGLNLSRKKLLQFARKLGCDVPFFVYDTKFAFATERGDRIQPVKSIAGIRLWHILVVPVLRVSTVHIYKKWDEFSGLTIPKYNVKLLISRIRKKALSFEGGFLFNSLEAVTTKLYPQVGRVKQELARLSLKSILMSGSGPAVFGILASRREAIAIRKQLRKQHKHWQVFVTRTV
jgi:4-diphosphocytidyl-2-C-methyl-D-erythritol kinase